MSITGIVLAGGKGRRMGGVDKGMVRFLGKPLVAQVDEILINANREIESYSAFGHEVIQDDIAGFAGPLAGLHKGMLVANHPYVITVPCDSPLIPTDLVNRLMRGLIEHNADVAVAKTGTQAHPVFCLCRTALLPNLENFLHNDGRKIDAWYASLQVAEILFDDNPQAFANINTREELLCLERAA